VVVAEHPPADGKGLLVELAGALERQPKRFVQIKDCATPFISVGTAKYSYTMKLTVRSYL
jgi:hypothetical protein